MLLPMFSQYEVEKAYKSIYNDTAIQQHGNREYRSSYFKLTTQVKSFSSYFALQNL